MRINSIQNNTTSFGAVTPIIATPKGAEKLEAVLAVSKAPYRLEDLTQLYKTTNDKYIQNVINQGKKILFLITGDDYRKYRYMEHGWGSQNALTQRTNRCLVNLTERTNTAFALLFKRTYVNK